MPVASRACKANCLLTFLNVTSGRKQKPISLKIELLPGRPMKWWPIKWKGLLWALTIYVAALRRAQWSAVDFSFSRGPEVWYLSKHQVIKAFLLCLISHGRPTPRAQIFSASLWSSTIISLFPHNPFTGQWQQLWVCSYSILFWSQVIFESVQPWPYYIVLCFLARPWQLLPHWQQSWFLRWTLRSGPAQNNWGCLLTRALSACSGLESCVAWFTPPVILERHV